MTSITKIQRAWNNRLNHINDLMAWMYDEDIMNKGEKAKKDTLFRKYYRFYNDGDRPRGKAYNRVNPHNIPEILELELEEFIKKILNKYLPKIDRKLFHIDQKRNHIQTVLNVIDYEDFHGLTKYWKKNVKDVQTLELIDSLDEKYTYVNNLLKDYITTLDLTAVDYYNKPSANIMFKVNIERLNNLKIEIPNDISIGAISMYYDLGLIRAKLQKQLDTI